MSYRVNDFFCGAGGVGVGYKNAGFDVVWACDFDKYAVETYRKNVGSHVVQADIKKLNWNDVPAADVWAFGFPCQDLSIAGNKRGFCFKCEDCGEEFSLDIAEYAGDVKCPKCGSSKHKAASRSGMFFEIMRLLDETEAEQPENMPNVLMAENVKGLKPYIPALEQEFKKRGYTAHVQLFNSKYWGVPQNRERYYIVGTRDKAATFQFPQEQHEAVPKLSSVLDTQVDEKYYIDDAKAQTIIRQALEKLETLGKVHATLTPGRENKRQNGPRSKPDEAEMFTLTAQDIHGVIVDEKTLMSKEYLECVVNDRGFVSKPAQITPIAPTLRAQDHGNQPKVIEVKSEATPRIEVIGMLENSGTTQQHNNRAHSVDGISPTLTAVSGGTHHIKIFDISRFRVRKLTPTEYGRLQAFPMEDWEQVVSDSQAYKQFGNAVTTTVVTAVAEQIKCALDEGRKETQT